MTPYEFQDLLRKASLGDDQSRQLLIWHRVCPDCGCTGLNVNSPSAFVPGQMIAVCLLCGWRTSPLVRLKTIPQVLLLQSETLSRRALQTKLLIIESFQKGAEVLPGEFDVHANSQREKKFSRVALKALLSRDELTRIERELPYQTQEYVQVVSKGTPSVPSYAVVAPLAPYCHMAR